MRIFSSEVQQVFRAYAKQLRSDYAKGRNAPFRETRAKGFEKVDISDEAKALAANIPELAEKSIPTEKQDKGVQKKNNLSDDSESIEKEADVAKDESGDSRSRTIGN